MKSVSAASVAGMLNNWAAASQSDKLGPLLPMRQLTRDGLKTTAFGMGGWHLGMAEDPKQAEAMIEYSMEQGVRFYDNARVYGKGRAEEYYGKFLVPKYREHVCIMTKSFSFTREDALKNLDESLTAMKTDYVDIWQIHSLDTYEGVDKRIKGGVVDAFLEAKQKGKAKYIGFTGHQNPRSHVYFLKKLKEMGVEMDVSQMPLNICDASYESFQQMVLPTLLEREYGVLAMKTFAGGSIMGRRFEVTPKELQDEDIPDVVRLTGLSLAQLHEYVYSLPVSVLISGCKTVDELEQNIAVLKGLTLLREERMEEIEKLAQPYSGYCVENYKRLL
ncbi:MAG: aldo/keto reductase [Puniceicoccaceae bacterium]